MHALLLAGVLAAGGEVRPPEVQAQQDRRSLLLSGALLTGVGVTGLMAGGLIFYVEYMSAVSLPVIPPVQPDHTFSVLTFGISGAVTVAGVVLLLVGRNTGRAPTAWLTPTFAPGFAGVSWVARF
ncbi:MAG: hypothetical protein ACOZQL_13760 [Myxococcota bacterium]